MADLLRMTVRIARTYKCRDRGLPLKEPIMALTPIHPGEHLKEELEALDLRSWNVRPHRTLEVGPILKLESGLRLRHDS
jgi:hypothetical protein